MRPQDNLRIARDLEEAGVERRQAEAVASAGGRADAQTAVSANLAMLKTDMATIKADIAWLKANAAAERSELRWMFGFLFALLLVVAARVFAIV